MFEALLRSKKNYLFFLLLELYKYLNSSPLLCKGEVTCKASKKGLSRN